MRVLITAPYFQPVLGRYASLFEQRGLEIVTPVVRERLSENELTQFAGDVDGVLCGDDRFSGEVLEQFAPRLRVISKWGTGIDSIDTEAARQLGIVIRNTPGAFTEAVADTVMGYVLSFARQLPWSHRAVASGDWTKLPGHALHETALGVVGVGKIGGAVIRRARAFGMRTLGNDIRKLPPGLVSELGCEMASLNELLERSDYVSLSCDLNPSSWRLIDAERLAMMRKTAVLINTARGGVVDEAALIEALSRGSLAGAALDVFEEEPLPDGSPLRTMENVLLAPHNANSSPEAWERVHRNTLRNLFEGLGLEAPDFGNAAG